MPIAKEILDMYEFSQNQNKNYCVDNLFNVCHLSQQRSVPIRSGLTPILGPSREDRTFHDTGTLNGSSLRNDFSKLRISMPWVIS